MSIALKDIAGLAELLEQTREVETETREDAWLGITRAIAGERIRVMTVLDYTALLQFASPLLNRRLPTPSELSFFLWVLSPEIDLWNRKRSWRKWRTLAGIEQMQCKRHGKRIRETLRLKELEEQERQWHTKSKLPFTLPDNAPFTLAVTQAFKYVDELFIDRPPGLKKNTGKSGLCYLTSWFDVIQSEYKKPDEEVWAMPIPVLFARLKAIQSRYNGAGVPEFSHDRDKIMRNIMRGLQEKRYTEEDLRTGRVDLVNNRLLNN